MDASGFSSTIPSPDSRPRVSSRSGQWEQSLAIAPFPETLFRTYPMPASFCTNSGCRSFRRAYWLKPSPHCMHFSVNGKKSRSGGEAPFAPTTCPVDLTVQLRLTTTCGSRTLAPIRPNPSHAGASKAAIRNRLGRPGHFRPAISPLQPFTLLLLNDGPSAQKNARPAEFGRNRGWPPRNGSRRHS